MKFLLLALLGMSCPCPVWSDEPAACHDTACAAMQLVLASSDPGHYGLLIAAPDAGCRHVRFRVVGEGGLLGRTPSLDPGELAIVRFSYRFADGDHLLTIFAEGCATRPSASRRVTLGKRSPDHGWRAEEALRMIAVAG